MQADEAERRALLASCAAFSNGDLAAITRLASETFGAVAAAVCLVADETVHVVAETGLGLSEAPFTDASTSGLLLQPGTVLLTGIDAGTRLDGSPLIGDASALRLYAGAPLRTRSDVVIGALCVLDFRTRHDVGDRQMRLLQALARQAAAELQIRHLTAQLRESEAHRSNVLALSPQLHWVADPDGAILELNDRWFALTGATPEASLGRNWLNFTHPDDIAGMELAFQTALRTGTALDARLRLRMADQTYRWFRSRAFPRRDEQGRIVLWYGGSEDIHDQVLAETALRDSEQRLNTIVNQAMVGILHRDPNGRVLMANERFCQLVGRSAEELTGLSMAAFTHPDDMRWNGALYDAHWKTGQPFQIEKRYLRPDGSVVWCNVHVSFVRDEQGNIVSSIVVAEDISDRRAAEAELRESRELLQTVIDSVADLIFVKDAEGRFVLVNRAASEGWGLHPGDRDVGASDGEADPGYRCGDRQVMATGSIYTTDEVIPIRGENRVFQTVKVPWRRSDEIVGVIGVSRDITERKKAEMALLESERHYRHSIELNPQIPWTAAPDGSIDEIGPRWEGLTGLSREEGRGSGWQNSLHPDDAPQAIAAWRNSVESGQPLDIEYRLRLPDGSYRWSRARAAPRRDEDGAIVRWYGTLEDIHDRKLADEAVRASEEQLQLAIKVAGIGIWDEDLKSGKRRWSGGLRAMLGLDESAPAEPETFLPLIHPDDRNCIEPLLNGIDDGLTGPDCRSVFRIKRADDGQWRWIAVDGRRIADNHGRPWRQILSLRDVTEERAAEERIWWAATHDPLTKLPNRSLFQEQLDQSLARSIETGSKIALLLLDVDQFKQVNDTLGHDAGDALLRTFSDRLRACVRSCDMVARLAGDEFVVILEDIAGIGDIEAIAATILQHLQAPFVYEGRFVDYRTSIGASLYPDHAESGADLMKNADMALYMAKATGRGGLMVFESEMRAEMQRRASMLQLAREALKTNRIVPFYQPKIELSTGRLIGFEALLRWRHPRGGIQSPASIGAAFEDYGLANAIGARIQDCVLDDVRHWLDSGVDFGHVAINASAAEFRHGNFAEALLEKLRAADIPARCIEIEVTETVFLGRGAEYVERALRTLSAEGVRIALDDFGTGYASLSHLKQFPVDVIKIDRSFVSDLENTASNTAIIRAVLNLGQNLGIKIVAEGVETSVQAAYLWAQGCDYGQGYLFGKPTPAGRLPHLIARWNPAKRWKGVGTAKARRADEP